MANTPIRRKDNFLIFGAPAIEDAEIEEVIASLKSGWLGTGPKVARFEEDFKKAAQFRLPKSEIEKALDFFNSIKNETSITLEFVDENGVSLWRFPQTSALRDLMSSVRYQSANVKEFLKDILND